MWARKLFGSFAEMTTSTPFRKLLHAANLRHGTDGFTSPPKEGVLSTTCEILIPQTFSRQRPSETTRLAKLRLQQVVRVCISLDIVFLYVFSMPYSSCTCSACLTLPVRSQHVLLFLYVLSMSYSIYLHAISYIARFL